MHIQPCKIKVPWQKWPETKQPPHHAFLGKIVSYLDTWAAGKKNIHSYSWAVYQGARVEALFNKSGLYLNPEQTAVCTSA